jgi:hypothetical protein
LTSPLTWYTTPDGLQWVIDPGVFGPADRGELGAATSWRDLAPLLKPDARP